MMKIINLTQHQATPDQIEAGVFDSAYLDKSLLNFDTPPDRAELSSRAAKLAIIASGSGATHAMIGGALYLMPHLEQALRNLDVQPVYAFTNRQSVDRTLPNGSVEKVAIFKFLGWVYA